MHADFQPCAYIMASARRGTLYTGVTSHLIQRVCQHRDGSFGGFTDRYAVKRLVWFELAGTMEIAIKREKQLKNWQRQWKIELIEATNPDWRDLAEELGLPPFSSPRT
ncbi:GIY-YIG nuclease family protein [uncultured Sphingopyxis sp.]|jgi:putative endonuclease|uniref:GIY-YIG nuclease family protein n=1 Tax=uncultured Sphingopyxis sp. TaxID=310581 RepID=UPI000ABEE9D8|nr:GIY-YIG nuclease family protein [uncultured Sphingopyxis sp.]